MNYIWEQYDNNKGVYMYTKLPLNDMSTEDKISIMEDLWTESDKNRRELSFTRLAP